MMTDLHFTVESPQPIDPDHLEWKSRIQYLHSPPVFALKNIHSQEVTIQRNQIQCAHISFTEPFMRIRQELCSQISEHSLEWFQQKCGKADISKALELQDFILVESSIIYIDEDTMYDDTLFENTMSSNTFMNQMSNVHEIYCIIQAVLYKETRIYLQVGVSHVRMKKNALQPALIDLDCELESNSPQPSNEELIMIQSQIKNALDRKHNELCELKTIEKFLQSEYNEKIHRIRKQKKTVSIEIESLEKPY